MLLPYESHFQKKEAAQKCNQTIIIAIHKFLFHTHFITDIRTVVTTLLFIATVITSAPLRTRLAIWSCLGNQEPTRDLQTFCLQFHDYQHHIHMKTSHAWLCKINSQCQMMIRPINAETERQWKHSGSVPDTGNTVLFPKGPNNSHTRLSPCAGTKKLHQKHSHLWVQKWPNSRTELQTLRTPRHNHHDETGLWTTSFICAVCQRFYSESMVMVVS